MATWYFTLTLKFQAKIEGQFARVVGGTPKKLGLGVRPASQNPYPIYDQNLQFSLPFQDLSKNMT